MLPTWGDWLSVLVQVSPEDVDLGEAMWAAWVFLVDTAAHSDTPPDRQRVIASALPALGKITWWQL